MRPQPCHPTRTGQNSRMNRDGILRQRLGANGQTSPVMKRRQFLKTFAFTGAAGLILPQTRLFGADAPSNKLNIALIGTWGRGEAHFAGISSENVVALCDVDEKHLAYGAEKLNCPKAKQYV